MADYTRLPAKGVRMGSSSRLYLAEDHLLSVETSLATESYIRFYFPDIQAVITRRTDRGAIWSVLLFFLSFVLAACTAGAAAPPTEYSAITWGILTVIFFAFAGWNLWQGATCRTHIQTAVGFHELPALCRVRTTRRILDRVRPLIDQAQGGVVSAATILEKTSIPVTDIDDGSQPLPAAVTPDHTAAPRPAARVFRIHLILFTIMLTTAVFDIAALYFYGVITVILGLLIALGKLGAVIVAVVVQDPVNSSREVRRLAWWALATVVVIMLMNYVYSMILSVSMIREGGTNPLYFYSLLVREGPSRFPGLMVLAYVSAGLNGIVGALGLVALGRSRQRPGAS